MTMHERVAAAIRAVAAEQKEIIRAKPGVHPAERLAANVIESYLLALNVRLTKLVEESPMLDRVKNLLRKALPLMEAAATMTETKLDDEAVKFLKAWLASGSADIQAFAATYQP